jgi:RHH-type proline utilization regulon transcriptional repressor/proline dehydrogenase/delta 1-pyrroline-5-carboxylate dehydrogenase
MNFNRNYLAEEKSSIDEMIATAQTDLVFCRKVETRATQLINAVSERPERLSALDRFLSEYNLAHTDGVVLMCLAESLLRIPDTKTADALIADKLSGPDWSRHLGTDDLLVNVSTWGLMMTGQLLPDFDQRRSSVTRVFKNLLRRLGELLIRNATRHAMRIIGDQFVIGATMAEALVRSQHNGHEYETFSFDVLGEGAVTKNDAERYFNAYLQGIEKIGQLDRPTTINTARGSR